MSDSVLCEICGWEKPQETPKDAQVKHNAETTQDYGLVDQFGRVYNKADASVVYILGYKKIAGVKKKQLDMYSGLTGYHIRSVPDRRWRNPVLVGAGAGYLGIVDRFADNDVIRITDERCGLAEENFDANGVVKDEVDLEQVRDLARITTPTGSHVSGLTILPRGVLIANITGDTPRFIKVDVWSLLDGKTQQGFNGVTTIGEPFDTFGPLKGSPARFDMSIGDNMFYFVGLLDGGVGKRGIVIAHLMTGEVRGFIGLPDKYVPLAVAHGQGNIHVLVQEIGATQGEVPLGTKVLRLPFVYGNYMLTGGVEGPEHVLEPQDLPVTHTYDTKDANLKTRDISGAIESARRVNTGNDDRLMGPEVTPGMVETRPLDATTAQQIAPRSQQEESHEQTIYSDGRKLPVTVLSIPSGVSLYDVEGFGNVLVEGSFENDPTKPFFRAFHGSHYDYLSDGGWMYGCVQEDSTGTSKTVLTNNGVQPLAMGVDNLINSGKLKSPPDFSAILIDNVSGQMIYRYPKPTGYQTYAGEFASLKRAEGNKLSRTTCTDQADNVATILDGVKRGILRVPVRDTEHPVPKPGFSPDILPVPAFNNDKEFDLPCELYDRRIAPSASEGELQLNHQTWTQREDDASALTPALLPEWRDGRVSPIEVTKSSEHGETFWPKASSSTGDPRFTASARGGFWFLNLMKQRTCRADELRLDIQDLNDAITALNTERQALELEQGTAAADRKTEITQRLNTIESAISSKENQIASKNEQLSGMDESDFDDNPVQFRTPRNIMNKVFKVEPRLAQEIDPVTGETNISSITPVTKDAGLWDVCPVTFEGTDPISKKEVEETKQCGIVVDPGIRSWIGVDIKVNYWGVSVDGADTYAHDATLENGLGINIGSAETSEHAMYLYGRSPGYTYESGYMCSLWGDGAFGVWEVTVKVNGKPIKKVCTRCTFLEQIYEQAPSEIADELFYDMTMNFPGDDNGFHRGHAYFTDQVVEEVTVSVKLINYATEVFRYGFSTIEIDHPWYFNCPGYDPGYWAGNDCEGMGCGNVSCTSLIFGGNHKLKANDPTIPLTKQLIWEGEATYKFKDDPFADKGLAVGRFIDCYFGFDLMSPITGYRVDISGSTYGKSAGQDW